MSRLAPPPAVRAIAERLESRGFETWCVGGAVRDALLGIPHLDWDLATAATPKEVQRLFTRVVPVGIEHGTVGVLDDEGTMHEVTTFRRDVRTDGRHAEVEFGVSLDDDLARRDFTVNAIAYSPSRDEIRDPFGGRADLEARVLRAVGEPASRMREDRLRALRAIRFAARFDFTIEPATWQAIVDSAPHLTRLSWERVRQELEKTLEQVPCPSRAFVRWREAGAFAALLPPLATAAPWHYAAADHVPLPGTTTRPERASLRRLVRLAALVAPLGPREAEGLLRRLTFSNADVAWVKHVAGTWASLAEPIAEALAARLDDATVRRWVSQIGRTRTAGALRTLHAIWNAQAAAGLPAPAASARRALYRRALCAAYRDPIELADLAVDGDDLLAAGVPRGPMLGRALQHLLAFVLEDPSRNGRDALLDEVRAWHATTR